MGFAAWVGACANACVGLVSLAAHSALSLNSGGCTLHATRAARPRHASCSLRARFSSRFIKSQLGLTAAESNSTRQSPTRSSRPGFGKKSRRARSVQLFRAALSQSREQSARPNARSATWSWCKWAPAKGIDGSVNSSFTTAQHGTARHNNAQQSNQHYTTARKICLCAAQQQPASNASRPDIYCSTASSRLAFSFFLHRRPPLPSTPSLTLPSCTSIPQLPPWERHLALASSLCCPRSYPSASLSPPPTPPVGANPSQPASPLPHSCLRHTAQQ